MNGRGDKEALMSTSHRTRKTQRWAIVAPLCVVGALVVAGVAGAANTGGFSDRAGDVKLAPDITSVAVSNDDAGTITIKTTFGNDALTPGLPGEQLGVALDLDQNPDTGTVYYGADVAFALDFGLGGTTLKFARAEGSQFKAATPPPSLKGTLDGTTGAVTFTVKAADLGLAPSDGFNLVAITSSIVGDGDLAPDLRTYNYQQVAGTPQPSLSLDTRAPVDHAFASKGVHGHVASLEYSAQDGRAATADTIRVYRGARLLRTIRIALGDSNPFWTYDARWRVPRAVHGRLRFCVQSVDAAGNKSNLSCARLGVR
jgi:hypothetical protein